MRGLEAVETAILLSISLAIIFAAIPYIIQNIFQIEAGLEARNVQALLVALADSLEADFGMTGVQRTYQLPSTYFGTFYVRTPGLSVTVNCSGVSKTYYFKELIVGYNSTYAEFGTNMLRGLVDSTVVQIGEPVIAVKSIYPRTLMLYSRVVYVNGSSLYLYTISASLSVQGSGQALSYAIGPLNSTQLICSGPATVTVSGKYGTASVAFKGINAVYLVWNNVTIFWK